MAIAMDMIIDGIIHHRQPLLEPMTWNKSRTVNWQYDDF